MAEKNKENFKFVWRVSTAHVIAYFIAGVFAMSLFDYESMFACGILSCLMKSTTDCASLGVASRYAALRTAYALCDCKSGDLL